MLKNGVKETSKCPVTNIHVNSAANSYLSTTTCAPFAGGSIQWGLNGALNAETQSKQVKLNAAIAD